MKPHPGVSRDKVRYASNRYSVLSGYVGMTHAANIILEKGNDASVSELHSSRPSFLSGVNHIVLSSSGRKVTRVDAGGIIARVHNVHAPGYRSIAILIGKTMGKLLSYCGAKAKHAVAIVVSICCPFPALGIGFDGNLGPESMIKHSVAVHGFPMQSQG